VLALWLAAFVWLPAVGLVPLLFLLVPDGRLPSPRWRPVAWVAVADMAVAMLAVVASVGLASRFRRARGTERQQLKWFAYGALLLLVGLAALFVPIQGEAAAKAILAVGVGCFGAGVALAVLRYGLYEIDVILNRTLVYGLLTAALGLGLPLSCSSVGSWPASSGPTRWSPRPPWPRPRCSSPPAAGSRRWWVGASTAASTTPPGPSRPSAPAGRGRPGHALE
jgi:hypothetical protein